MSSPQPPGLLASIAARMGMHLARRRHFDLVPRSFYSPVPDLDALPPGTWDRRSALHGISLDPAAMIASAETELARYVPELEAPSAPTGKAGAFHFENAYYESGDAEIAYAMVRHLRPERIVELGSGFSTLVLARAAEANARDGAPARLQAYSPYPTTGVSPAAVPGLTAHHEVGAHDVPLEVFESLQAGDILFVDTSHVVRLGGDVNLIVLEILPLLASGVVVHFHDIWLPYEYHRDLVAGMGMYWSEQYLLQAFLAFNPHWEVLWAARAVAREQPQRLRRLLPRYDGSNFPSAWWMRRS